MADTVQSKKWRFSLRSLIVFCLFCGVLLLLWLQVRENQRLRLKALEVGVNEGDTSRVFMIQTGERPHHFGYEHPGTCLYGSSVLIPHGNLKLTIKHVDKGEVTILKTYILKGGEQKLFYATPIAREGKGFIEFGLFCANAHLDHFPFQLARFHRFGGGSGRGSKEFTAEISSREIFHFWIHKEKGINTTVGESCGIPAMVRTTKKKECAFIVVEGEYWSGEEEQK